MAHASGAGVCIVTHQSAQAETGLPIGSCVVADRYHPGRIIQVIPYGYVVKGFGPNDSALTWPQGDVVPGPCADAPPARVATPTRNPVQPSAPGERLAGGQCFPNDPVGGPGLDGRVRAVLIRSFAHQPQPGEDGRITVHVQNVRTGGSHRASPVDHVQYQTAPRAIVYDVRASFETCTDYNSRRVFTTRERNFACFNKASGVFDCSMTANSPGLAQDQSHEVRN
jgi:hypothetical protein